MDGVNVLTNNLRTVIRKDVPFIPGAWVGFWDSVTIGDIKHAQMKEGTVATIDGTIELLISQIAEWNFKDGDKILPITKETFDLFSTKFIEWFSQMQAEILQVQTESKKKSLDNLSNSSPSDTQTQ
jgi:hypothetical protein